MVEADRAVRYGPTRVFFTMSSIGVCGFVEVQQCNLNSGREPYLLLGRTVDAEPIFTVERNNATRTIWSRHRSGHFARRRTQWRRGNQTSRVESRRRSRTGKRGTSSVSLLRQNAAGVAVTFGTKLVPTPVIIECWWLYTVRSRQVHLWKNSGMRK